MEFMVLSHSQINIRKEVDYITIKKTIKMGKRLNF